MSEQWYDGACFSRKFTFRFGDCDVRKNAGIYSIMKLFTEAAGDDYEGRNLGHGFLWEHGQVFVVSRLALDFYKIPVYGETVVLTTWEREIKGPFFCRDFEIKGEKGELMVTGTSQWLLVNPNTREILRPASLFGGLLEGNPCHADCHPCKKLRMPPNTDVLGERTIFYSDLDSNGHVNNAVYSRIAVDFMPEKYRDRDLMGMDISFNLETKLGDTLKLCGADTSDGYEVFGTIDEAMRFACEFQFNKDTGSRL